MDEEPAFMVAWPMTADDIADDFSYQIERNPDENEWVYPFTISEGFLPLYIEAQKILQESYGTFNVLLEVLGKDKQTNKTVYELKVKRK